MYITVLFIGGGLYWVVNKINKARELVDENMEYIYRKKDGQKV